MGARAGVAAQVARVPSRVDWTELDRELTDRYVVIVAAGGIIALAVLSRMSPGWCSYGMAWLALSLVSELAAFHRPLAIL
jgi:hypothetical protein